MTAQELAAALDIVHPDMDTPAGDHWVVLLRLVADPQLLRLVLEARELQKARTTEWVVTPEDYAAVSALPFDVEMLAWTGWQPRDGKPREKIKVTVKWQ